MFQPLIFFFFFFGSTRFELRALPFESLPQPFLLLVIVQVGSCVSVQAGLDCDPTIYDLPMDDQRVHHAH
jgi:hypothetical protein